MSVSKHTDGAGRGLPGRRSAPPRELRPHVRGEPRRAPRFAPALALIALLSPLAAADDGHGEALLREALAALAKNDPATALDKAKEARPDLPGSPELAQIVADAERLLGHWDEAVDAYGTGAQGPYVHRSHFNSGVTEHERAEKALADAKVPLDPSGLPPGPQPEMSKAITANEPALEQSKEDFLRALDDQPDDAAARESVAALNRRLDDLRAMREELEKRQQDQDKKQDKDKDKKDQKDKDKKDQDKKNKDQQDKQKQDPQDKDKNPKDKDPQDKDKQDADKDKQPKDGKDGKPDQQGEPKEGDGKDKLGKEQIQQIFDQISDLEKEGRALQKAREIAQRQPVEKDW